jgi:hypothetical protein
MSRHSCRQSHIPKLGAQFRVFPGQIQIQTSEMAIGCHILVKPSAPQSWQVTQVKLPDQTFRPQLHMGLNEIQK